MSKGDGRKGSQLRVVWCADAETALESTKVALCEALELQTVNADLPFVLRVDASGRAMGAAL